MLAEKLFEPLIFLSKSMVRPMQGYVVQRLCLVIFIPAFPRYNILFGSDRLVCFRDEMDSLHS